jgi:hypothetical protein
MQDGQTFVQQNFLADLRRCGFCELETRFAKADFPLSTTARTLIASKVRSKSRCPFTGPIGLSGDAIEVVR